MRNFLYGMALLLTVAIFAGAARAQDNTESNGDVSFQTFYDQLATQGTWINTTQFGNVWQPTENDPNWRPYMYGHWVNTDQGMTWESDEPFGWAVYHYGRWTNLAGYGWVWVPGYTWAPAWVSWRDGDDEVGWAPLPPASDEGIDYYDDDSYFTGFDLGFHIGNDCDVAYGIGPAWYTFCPVIYIGDRDCWRHFRDCRDNFGFIGRTRNVTNINFRRDGTGRFGHVRAQGPSVARLNAQARNPIREASLVSAANRNAAGLHGRSLAVFAPHVDGATFRSARPSHVGAVADGARVNRGTDISQPLATNSRFHGAAPSPEQVRAANAAQASDVRARVATANTPISRNLNQPLTSMRTTQRTADEFSHGPFRAGSSSHFTPTPAESQAGGTAYRGGRESMPTLSSSRESAVRGQDGFPPRNALVNDASAFSGARSHANAPAVSTFPSSANAFAPRESYPRSGGVIPSPSTFRSDRAFHSSTPAFNAGAPVYHPSAPAFQSSTPAFRSSTPAYHPQESFRAMGPAPTPHFGGGGFSNGGGFRAAAPMGGGFHAAPPSGGGFHGGAPAGGGGGHGGGHR